MSDKSILELMTNMKTLADEIIEAGESLFPEPKPEPESESELKPVDWQVIMDEGLLCEFWDSRNEEIRTANLMRVKHGSGLPFLPKHTVVEWKHCQPLAHQSVLAPRFDGDQLQSTRLKNLLSGAGFQNVVGDGPMTNGHKQYLTVIITGPADGYTYEVQS